MDARFEVPLPHLDLSTQEAYAQSLESLAALEQASKGVFADISRRVLEERGAHHPHHLSVALPFLHVRTPRRLLPRA